MSTKESKQPRGPAKVIDLNEHRCRGEDCKKKAVRAGFCSEHYEWFKWGLITMEGYKARDFDKKYQGYLQAKKSAA